MPNGCCISSERERFDRGARAELPDAEDALRAT